MTISAPFRFARINRWVFKPSWGQLVSHDVPFSDGYSGVIEFTIKSQTPLMVGGPRTAGDDSVSPFQLPCGRYAIPSSSIQGMIRSILEIATFGKLGPFVQDRRFAVRDISGRSATAEQIYKSRMVANKGRNQANPIKSKTKPGWLVNSKTGLKIVPCQMARIDAQNIGSVLHNSGISIAPNTLSQFAIGAGNADERLELLFGKSRSPSSLNVQVQVQAKRAEDHTKQIDRDRNREKWIEYQRCVAPQAGVSPTKGTLVVTGKASSGLGDGKKKLEFIFHTPCREDAITTSLVPDMQLSDDVIRDFFAIHDPDTGQSAVPNPNWAFWKPHFKKGEPVPVFYLEEEGKVTAVGTAQMFKLAMKLSTHDLLKNSALEHVSKKENINLDPSWGDWDLPSLIFGATGGADDSFFEKNLKRRAAFDVAVQINNATEITNFPSAALLGPKPSYYPIYVRQRYRQANGNEIATHETDRTPYVYATYNKMDELAEVAEKFPELSGVKIWPSVGRIDQPNVGDNVDTKLKPINSGAEFKCAVRVHNLRKFELGALLWALTFGDPEGTESRVHKLGGGKPLGLGSVLIAKLNPTLTANANKVAGIDIKSLIAFFVEKMTEFTSAAQTNPNVTWENTPQVKALIKASKTQSGVEQNYRYMRLSVQPPVNQFQDEKSDGTFLPSFADSPISEFRKLPPRTVGGTPPVTSAQPRNVGNHVPAQRETPALPKNFAHRCRPPEPQQGHPATDKFEIGQKVTAKNNQWWIIGFPHATKPRMQQNDLKWYLGRYSEAGTVFYDDVVQVSIRPIIP